LLFYTKRQHKEKKKMITLLNTLLNWLLTAGIRILVALLILIVSFKLINVFAKKIEDKIHSDGKHKMDKTLASTLVYIGKIAAKVLVVVCLVGYLGIDTSGITALIASFGVCIGLAVNGAVGNFAGGALILITRPFRVDDFIEAQGYSGVVEDIRMTATRLRTVDNKIVYIPNGALSSGSIVNYSEKDTRRVDFTFSIAYENDFKAAKQIILDICNAHELVLKDEALAPFVRVSAHGDSAVNIATRVWVKSGDYWTVNFDILESVKEAFDEKGISIPYNQLDVHVKNN